MIPVCKILSRFKPDTLEKKGPESRGSKGNDAYAIAYQVRSFHLFGSRDLEIQIAAMIAAQNPPQKPIR